MRPARGLSSCFATFVLLGVVVCQPALAQSSTSYSISGLPAPAGTTAEVAAINNNGDVVGRIRFPNGTSHAFLWKNTGETIDLGTLGGQNSVATGINDAGQVVGWSDLPNPQDGNRAFMWIEGSPMVNIGTLFQVGGEVLSVSSAATGINSAGQIVGMSSASLAPNRSGISGAQSGFVYSPQGMMSPAPLLSANGISEDGQAAGIGLASTFPFGIVGPFYWDGTSTSSISMCFCIGSASAVNDGGQVVGSANFKGGPANPEAFVWTQTGGFIDLGAGLFSSPSAINNRGLIVGGTGAGRAFLWENGILSDINGLIDPNAGWVLSGAADINDVGQIIGSGTLNGEQRAFLLTPTDFVPAPTGLRAVVGDGTVYLYWDASGVSIDGHNIRQEDEDTGTITVYLRGPETSQVIVPLIDGRDYSFTVTAIKDGKESGPSNTVVARPGGFAAPRSKPNHPILFLHGFWGGGDLNGTWKDTIHFLETTLQWRFGGQLYHLDGTAGTFLDPTGGCRTTEPSTCTQGAADILGDFFTASFRSNTGALFLQGDEVNLFVRYLESLQTRGPIDLVAHSNGGLAARDYITRFGSARSLIGSFVSYGSPHRGADLTPYMGFFAAIQGVPLSVARAVFFSLYPGAQDAAFECSGQTPSYFSSFLPEVNSRTLPSEIRYAAIIGHSHSGVVSLPFGVRSGPEHRSQVDDCHSKEWDGLVPTSSADLSQAGVGSNSGQIRRLIVEDRPHIGQGNDFPSILCALYESCLQINAMSPVELMVTAPDGQVVAKDRIAIPAASYMTVEDRPGHETATVLIPFPLPGQYIIRALPKPGASPADTFTIIVTQNGVETVVAQDMRVQDAPADGFTVRSNTPPVANAGPDQIVECASHLGTPVVLDGSASMDIDGDPLTYRWRDAGGNLVASSAQAILTLPLGAHAFSLTVTDSHGASSSDTVMMMIQDTTPPVLTLAKEEITVVVPTASATGAPVELSGVAHVIDLCDPDVTITHNAPALFPIGVTAVTFAASDDSRNTSQKELTVYVVYNFGGFLPPINAVGSSVFRSGRAIPLKFQLTAGDGSLITNAVATLQVFKVTDQVTGTVDEITPDAAGASNTDNLFRYDPTINQYIYNLKTTGYSAGTYLLRVRLNDGIKHEVLISVR